MIDLEKLADEFLHGADRNGAYYGFVEELKQFAEAYAEKVLEDKEREIAELKDDYLELRTTSTANAIALMSLAELNAELQAHINDLREALEKLARLGNEPNYGNSIGNDIAKRALVATPVQHINYDVLIFTKDSLQEHDNKLISRISALAYNFTGDEELEAEIEALKVSND